jgi:myotubularin-related protein 9
LIELFDNVFASNFGTFLCNSEKERKVLKVAKQTASLWSFLNDASNIKKYANVIYEANNRPIWPSLHPLAFNFWSALYMRFVRDNGPYEEYKQEVAKLKEKETNLRQKTVNIQRY